MSTPKPTTPAETARETLKLLMTRRMAPSPDNYRTIYNEIAGINDKAAEVFPEKELRALIGALPKEVPLQQRLARELDQVVAGWPLNFWLAAQGGVLTFIAVVMAYAWWMNRAEAPPAED